MHERGGAARVEILGPPRVVLPDGRAVLLEGKTAALLAYLALEGAQPRATLAALLWPDTLPGAARNNLVHLVRRLRALTGRALVGGRETLALAPDVMVDAHEDAGDAPAALLAGLHFDEDHALADWLLARREALDARRAQVRRARIDARAEAGDLDGALRLAEELLEGDLLAEDAHRLLMTLHYRNGDRPAAMRAYRRCEEVLRQEVGVAPSPDTRRLARDVESGALPAPSPAFSGVPLEVLRPPALIGREAAWAQLEDAWRHGHSLVIEGGPGSGKTRLATDFLRAQSTHTALPFGGQAGDAAVPSGSLTRFCRDVLAAPSAAELPAWVRRALTHLAPNADAPGAPPKGAQLHVFAALAEAVQQRARRHPLVLVCEDLHLMDDASVQAAAYLLSHVRGAADPEVRGVLVLQPELLSGAAARAVGRLSDGGLMTTVKAEPLTPPDVEALLEHLGVPDAGRLGGDLHALTGGVPRPLLSAVKLMFQRGTFEARVAVEHHPDGAAGLLAGRLAGLSDVALQTVRAAAVLRGDLTPEGVAAVLRCSLLDVADAWEELEAAQLVQGEGGMHEVVAQAVLDQTPEVIRALLVRSAARVLQQAGRAPEP